MLDDTRLMAQVDPWTPSVSRIDDYFLGGGHNFAADRWAAEKLVETVPGIKNAAIAHSHFVARAVRTLAALDVWQFLDLGAGVSTLNSPHRIAREVLPGPVVVSVDNDPLAVAHLNLLTDPYVETIEADLTDLELVLGHKETLRLLDFTRPVAVLMCASLQHLLDTADDDASALVAAYVDVLCPGSYLVMSHMTADYDAAAAAAVQQRYATTSTPVRTRTASWLSECFTGLELLEPGVTTPASWRPDGHGVGDHPDLFCVAVGRKPGA